MKRLYRLYLGRSIGKSDTVSNTDFARFLQDSVTPVFAGYTLLRALGYWDDHTEASEVLEIVGAPADRSKVEAIAEQYATRFSQDSVLLTESDISGTLILPRQKVKAA